MAYQARLSRLRRQTSLGEPPPATDPAAEPSPAPATAPASRPWIRIVLAGLAGTLVVAFLLLRLYHAVGPSMTSGGFWVTADAPRAVVNLPFTREPQQVTLSNTAGAGTADVSVSPVAGDTSPSQRGQFEFAGSATRFTSSTLDLHGRAPGNYRLVVTLREGPGGLVRYIALSGGGPPAQLAAVAVGLAVGLVVALATILVLEVRAEQGVFRGAA